MLQILKNIRNLSLISYDKINNGCIKDLLTNKLKLNIDKIKPELLKEAEIMSKMWSLYYPRESLIKFKDVKIILHVVVLYYS